MSYVVAVVVVVADVFIVKAKPLGSGKVRLVQYQPFSLLAMALASA